MKERLHYIDWLRVLAFVTLILFHCAVPFVEHYTWEINNDETSPWITRLIWWLHQWRLPLLFFIAGVGVRFSLKRRTILAFLGERFVRLFIPLAFAIFFVTPIQVYFEWLQKGRISVGYSEFYPSVYEIVPYPDGSFTWSHMWFVAYLFVFTILLLPVFSLAKVKWLNRFNTFFNVLFSRPIAHLFLAIPFVFYFYLLYIDWPEQGSLINDWYVFVSSITFYFLGFVLSSISSFWETCKKYRRLFLWIALLLAVSLIWKYYWNWELYKPTKQGCNLYVYGLLNGFHIWVIILSAIGYTMKYLNFSNTYLSYLNTAVYPFYIIHQAIIVASGYFVLQWNIGIGLKLLVLVVVCVSSIWFLYHFLIRKTIVTHVLFGMKWKRT
ncbi:acyltransferase [Flagellimonas aquimarina]|uniref:Acyltransferase n=1 Tax=Flagellimonas aquimarina TaxID=2201895 RepID=A0A316KXI2_9FLAO|nr:acyltransferase family protein [Allomuricauda koreensis]PWL38937.1 acyltransferase [Allomuricauda koreensis]